ncbi:MAG: family 1 encapsulin nanocompartment shell protein [Halanaerobiales bacterium]
MDILNRSLAPIPQEAWDFIDEEAREILTMYLNGRKAVDFAGPKGIDFGVVNTGRVNALENEDVDGVDYSKRVVLPLVEVRVPFKLDKKEIESLARGAVDVETEPLIEAARKVSKAEDSAIFYGLDEANIKGIISTSEMPEKKLGRDKNKLVSTIVSAINDMNDEGVDGPFNLMLGSELYNLVYELDDKGYPLINKLSNVIGGEIVNVPTLGEEGVLMSTRGDDFELIVGQDISVGYNGQQGDELEFFFFETFTFRVNSPEAAVVLK